MGQILSQPVTDKLSEKGGDTHLSYGLSCMQGWRINMEDAHATILDLPRWKPAKDGDKNAKSDEIAPADETADDNSHVAFFGVYDGHGGERAAIFAGHRLHEIVRSTEAFQKADYITALKEGFLSCDQAILQDYDMRDDDSGCAATSAIITDKKIVCGNAGDSRTVMSINGFAKALSYDHKPSNEGEKARICAAGGYVDMGRVNGNLALSRGIGDFEFKKNVDLPAEEQIVTCYPDVIQHDINFEKDEFVILACDGIWDCLTSQNAVECVRRGVYEKKPLTQICEEMMELCCAPTSDGSGIGCDNMSIVIVALLDYAKKETLEQWYEKIAKKVELNQQADDKEDAVHYGPISAPYNDIYQEMFGYSYEIGQQGLGAGRATSNGSADDYPLFGGLPGALRQGANFGGFGDDDEATQEMQEDVDHDEAAALSAAATGAISLQKLLASNAITNENGVIYLDTSSAQSLLAHFGMAEGADGDVHDKHFEEDEVLDEEEEDDDKEESKQDKNDAPESK